MSDVVGSKKASEILGVSQRAITALCERGTLKGMKLGREWAIDKQSVIDYKAQKESGQSHTEDNQDVVC